MERPPSEGRSRVVIEDYDPRWPELFETLRARISASLGSLAAEIEHVGSTAVRGLAAKPIIDMDVLLDKAADLNLVIARLAGLGYGHEGDLGVQGREAFKSPAGDIHHHLYVCLPKCAEYRRHLRFRDHLRAHPGDADAYAELKRRLAAAAGSDRNAYVEGKRGFVEEILSK